MLCVDGAPVRGNGFLDAVADARAMDRKFSAAVEPQERAAARIRLAGDAELPETAELIAVLFQEKATTECTAGENKGKRLVEYFVVRAVTGALDLEAARKKGVTARFEAPKGVPRANLGIAFLLEDRARMKTIDCWWTPLEKTGSEDTRAKKPAPKKPDPKKPDAENPGKPD